MKQDHTRLEEFFAAEALGGLDEADRAELALELEGHGGECAVCRTLRTQYREVAARLALVAANEAPVEQDRGASPERPRDERPRPLATVLPLPHRPRPPTPRRATRAIAVAAAAVLLAAAGFSGYLLAPDRGPGQTLAALLAGPDARVVRLAPDGGEGDLVLAFAPGLGRSFLMGSGLADPPGDDVYQLWMISGGVPVSAGVFLPVAGRVLVEVPADPGGSDTVAVTIEPSGGSAQPTGAPVFSAPVTGA